MAPHHALVAACLLPTVKAAKEVEIDVENLVKAEAQMLIYLFQYAALFLYPSPPVVHQALHAEDREHDAEYMDKMSSTSETKKANVSSSKRSGGKLWSFQTVVLESDGVAESKWIGGRLGEVPLRASQDAGSRRRGRRKRAWSLALLRETRKASWGPPAFKNLRAQMESSSALLREKEPSMQRIRSPGLLKIYRCLGAYCPMSHGRKFVSVAPFQCPICLRTSTVAGPRAGHGRHQFHAACVREPAAAGAEPTDARPLHRRMVLAVLGGRTCSAVE